MKKRNGVFILSPILGRKLRISSFPRMTIFLCLDNGPKICPTRRISSQGGCCFCRSVYGSRGSSSVFRDPNHIKFKVIMWSIKIPGPNRCCPKNLAKNNFCVCCVPKMKIHLLRNIINKLCLFVTLVFLTHCAETPFQVLKNQCYFLSLCL